MFPINQNYIYKFIYNIGVVSWVTDSIYIYILIAKKFNIRILENYILSDIDPIKVSFSYNYVFDLDKIDTDIIRFLNITEENLSEIEKLPNEIVRVLTMADGWGRMFNTATSYNMDEIDMQSYGDIVKINKHKFADPLFSYKLSIKSYTYNKEIQYEHKSDKLILGYFLNSFSIEDMQIILKMLGVISLMNKGIKIVLYEFYGPFNYNKILLESITDIINFFNTPKQLNLYPLNNSKAIKFLSSKYTDTNIIFIPNTAAACYPSDVIGNSRINIISSKESMYNLNYANICKKTNGIFTTI